MAEHPITPPPELVCEWFLKAKAMPVDQWVTDVATQAARWGADMELESCCKLLELSDPNAREFLYAARRPKPPSIKELALTALIALDACAAQSSDTTESVFYIRRALESLPD